jgi:lytic murein transglycosylase
MKSFISTKIKEISLLLGLLCFFLNSGVVFASDVFAECGGNFQVFLEKAKKHAQKKGVSEKAISESLKFTKFNKKIIEMDRRQKSFKMSFMDFSGRAINNYRLVNGKKNIKKHSIIFEQANRLFGVPAEVITAFWAMETDFGAVQGEFHTLSSLATLGFDCRRPELFQPEFIAAIQLVERGDIDAEKTTGAWAGEIGQVQMLPKDILEFGFDGNGDGKVLLKESAEDAIMTAANLIGHMGWVKNEPWLDEVFLSENFHWQLAGFGRSRPSREWKKLGVKLRQGDFSEKYDRESTLLLPQGRYGPAFLAYRNFEIYLKWNDSFIYTVTAAHLATRLEGRKKYKHKNPEGILTIESMILLQNLLHKRGYDVGKIDGILGAKTRQSVRKLQLLYGLPADSWPNLELLELLTN